MFNHILNEKSSLAYDIVEPLRTPWADNRYVLAARTIDKDCREIPPDLRYHQILSIAVLGHLTDLPAVMVGCGTSSLEA